MAQQRKQLSQWQMLVIEQLLEHAEESGRYEPASIKSLVTLWRSAQSVSVKMKES
jgi:hypothetical protein